MKRTALIAAVVALATPVAATAKTAPITHPAKHVAAAKTLKAARPATHVVRHVAKPAPRPTPLCICVAVQPNPMSPEDQAEYEAQVDRDLVDAGLEPIYGTIAG